MEGAFYPDNTGDLQEHVILHTGYIHLRTKTSQSAVHSICCAAAISKVIKLWINQLNSASIQLRFVPGHAPLCL